MTSRERPIIFSSPMVRAILEGRKTQTRRIVKFGGQGMPQSVSPEYSIEEDLSSPYAKNVRVEHGHIVCDWMTGRFSTLVKCPYGVPADRLWVRETWRPAKMRHGLIYRADFSRADCPELLKWKSPLFLTREASRITLEITDVRVQRLHDISEDDATSEGVDAIPQAPAALTRKTAFAGLWNHINGKRAPWESNPWVWAITFKRVLHA